ncbi:MULTISPECIES: hemerythrin domain-containing protein [Methanobacterium]|uniref:Hemerythrin-like domain-containing protein n=1 Tax=Methanobacterium veterum TaxID=408577 RepID=A0A9E4ZX35_9EURY|nr:MULTISPECIES: hemerythrin domain-containing protein [Methanobacterium]MCZ3366826.1 hypothetical protein [Methanobacterium veterum]MCZ3374027.1 hypothetical protein [Methanobacterium veterum]
MAKGDVYKVFKKDHAHIKKLFNETLRDTSKYPEARRELEANMLGEEQFLYPAMDFIDEDMVNETKRENEEAFRTMARMKNMNEEDREWVDSLRRLNDLVVHHMEIEEKENGLFDKASEVLSEEAEEDILHLYNELKAENLPP